MAEKIQVVVDVNTESVTIATDRTLTLQQQLKVLRRELQTVPEGTKEWNLINAKFNDTKDSLDRVNVKSRELFGTLNLIPGPIGAIAGKLNGAIDAIKVFSGFKLTDIQAQMSAFGDDINGVIGFLGKITGVTKVYTVANTMLARAFTAVGVAEGAAATGARAFAAALTATGIGAIVVAIGVAIGALMEYAESADKAAEAQKQLNEQQLKFAEEGLKGNMAANKRNEELEIARAKAAGKTEEEIYQIRLKYAQQRTGLLESNVEEQKAINRTATNESITAVKDAQAAEQILTLENEARKREAAEKTYEKNKELQKKRLEDQKKEIDTSRQLNEAGEAARQAALLKGLQTARAISSQTQEIEEQRAKERFVRGKMSEEEYQLALFDIQEKYATDLFELSKIRLEREQFVNEKRTEQRDKFLEQQKASVEKEKEYFEGLRESTEAVTTSMEQSFQQLYFSIGNALSSVGNLFEEGSAAQKIFGVLSVAVNAATAIGDIISRTGSSIAAYTKAAAESKAAIVSGTVALAAGNPRGAFQIKAGTAGVAAATKGIAAAKAGGVAQGIAVAAGAAGQIAAILSSKKSTTSPGGTGGGGTGGAESPTPAFSAPSSVSAPQVGASAAQQGTIANIVAGTIGANQSQSQPIRAYVVQNDLRTESQLDRRIRTAARLGG